MADTSLEHANCRPPPRQYAHTITRGGGVRLGLGISDIPHAGWGVFALGPIAIGTIVLDYSGRHLVG